MRLFKAGIGMVADAARFVVPSLFTMRRIVGVNQAASQDRSRPSHISFINIQVHPRRGKGEGI